MSTLRSSSRACEVSSRKSDSGVVIRMSGGSRSIAARSFCGVSPVRTATRSSDCEPRERPAQVALDVVVERLQRRDVEDAQPCAGRRRSAGRSRRGRPRASCPSRSAPGSACARRDAIAGQPCSCAGVGASKLRSNHARVSGAEDLQTAPSTQGNFPPVTYSIVARDEATGELGVAVQSRAFGVGICAWARPGVGAVATQSFTEKSYGPRGLDLLAAGTAPADALAELVAADEKRDFRQVAFLAADGRTAAHTGAACIPDCGHIAREGVSAQGNMLSSPAVWHAAAETFSETPARSPSGSSPRSTPRRRRAATFAAARRRRSSSVGRSRGAGLAAGLRPPRRQPPAAARGAAPAAPDRRDVPPPVTASAPSRISSRSFSAPAKRDSRTTRSRSPARSSRSPGTISTRPPPSCAPFAQRDPALARGVRALRAARR